MQPPNTARRVYLAVAAVLAWFAIVAQLYVTTAAVVADERTVLDGVITFLSYFTVLTNIITALALTTPLVAPASGPARFFERPATQGAIATYIAVVGAVYSLMLRHLWQPTGLQLVVDSILHDIIPLVFVIHWFVFVPKRRLRWTHAVLWLAYPLAYVLYTLLRGAVSGRYPYPFSDVTALGYPQVFLNTLLLLVGFLVVGSIFVGLDRLASQDRIRIGA